MLTTSTVPLAPGVWTLDPLHCTVEFTVRHMAISKVRGRFHTFHANVVVGDSLQTTSVRAVVDLASVDTNNDDRDAHLRSSDFFAVDAHPQMTFTSTAITEAGPQRYEVTGDLSVNGITRSEILIVDLQRHGDVPTRRLRARRLRGNRDHQPEGLRPRLQRPPRRWRVRHRRPDRHRTRSPAPRSDGMNSQRPNSRARRTCL